MSSAAAKIRILMVLVSVDDGVSVQQTVRPQAHVYNAADQPLDRRVCALRFCRPARSAACSRAPPNANLKRNPRFEVDSPKARGVRLEGTRTILAPRFHAVALSRMEPDPWLST